MSGPIPVLAQLRTAIATRNAERMDAGERCMSEMWITQSASIALHNAGEWGAAVAHCARAGVQLMVMGA